MSFKHLDQLNDFVSDVFIETGTYHGNTARAAKDAGFKKVVTIELQDYLYEISKAKSAGYDIQFEKGDSIEVLKKVLPTIEGSITFWLDAHIDGGNYVPGITPEIRPCPLYEELDLIKNLERNDHTILIDDMRILGKLGWGLEIGRAHV